MKRAAVRSLVGLGGLLLLVVLIVVWLVTTQPGLDVAWRVAGRYLPAELEIGTLEGRLIGPLVVRDVRYTAPPITARIERVELEWQVGALIGRAVNIQRLALDGVDIAHVPEVNGEAIADDAPPFALPDRIGLPVTVNAERVEATRIAIRLGDDMPPVEIERLGFGAAFAGERVRIHEFAIDAPLFDARLYAEATLSGRYPLEVELDGTVRPANGFAPVTARATAAGSLDEFTAQVSVEPPYALELQATVFDVMTEIALDGALSARVRPDELGVEAPVSEAALDVTFDGRIAELAATGRVEAAVPQLIDAVIHFDVRRDGAELVINTLDLADAASPAALQLAGRTTLDAVPAFDLSGRWQSLRWPLDGAAQVSSASGEVDMRGTLDDFVATLDAALGDGRVDGDVRLVDERFEADLDWTDLAWPMRDPTVLSPTGSLQASGTFDDYVFMLDAALEPGPGAPVQLGREFAAGYVAADGAGGRSAIELVSLDLQFLGGTLTGDARVAFAPALAGDLRLDFAGLDPGLFAPAWAGHLDGGIEAYADTREDGMIVRVEQLAVDGRLRDRPLQIDLRGTLDTATTRVDIAALTARAGGSSLSAEGQVGSQFDAEWSLTSPDLGDFWPQLSGRLDTAGRIEGPVERPRVEGRLTGADLVFDGYAVDAVDFDAVLDAAGVTPSDFKLSVDGARIGETAVERLEVTAAGTAAAHELRASGLVAGASLEVALRGALERAWQPDFAWRFTLEQSAFGYEQLAPWAQGDAADGVLVAGGANLEPTCWRSGEASLCVHAEHAAGSGATAGLELSRLPFQYFAAFLPADARINGSVNANAALEWPVGGSMSVQGEVLTSRTRVRAVTAAAAGGMLFAPGAASVTWRDAQLDASLSLPLVNEPGGVEATLTVDASAAPTLGDAPIEGALAARFADLSFIADVVQGISDVEGAAVANLRVGGTVGVPSLEGRASVEGGTALIRAAGVRVEDVHVTVDGAGRSVSIDGDATSGGGPLSLDGALTFEAVGPVGQLSLRGRAFELFNSPDARVFASPELDLTLASTRIDLTGRIALPEARFTPRDSLTGAVTVTDDEIIVDSDETRERVLSRPFYARVALELGDAVTVEGFGLSGRLAGGIEIVEIPSEPVTGSGELRVEQGTYEAYGQELEVRTGRLVFAGGALTRPGVDIEAVRRPTEDILVGARVRGTLDRPELSIFSEPSMPRQEQLSYLVLGRPLESTSTSETSALSQAAMALGLRGGNVVSERLNTALGFDEFGIQTQPSDAASASFVIGKYLTPSLYVSYGVGLFEPVNTLRLRYTISSRWRLVTESSSVASGGDLIYHIERGD